MHKREEYDNGVLSVRFVGEQLKEQGVSIYDLGVTLLAIQRIVHKAHLSMEDRLKKGAYPHKDERPALALQLGERRRSSDAFPLIPILSDPNVQTHLKTIANYIASGIVGYYTGDVLKRIHKERDDSRKIFIGSIHTEVANIVTRIGTTGGVEAISLGAPALEQETIAAFKPETKDYLTELKGETFLGSYQEIDGRVYRFYPNSNIVTIRRAGGTTVSIFLEEEDFKQVRYIKQKSPKIRFKGHPVYKFGIETKAVSEFQADEIEFLPEES